MVGWLIWVLGGLVLLGAELVLPGVFLMWVGLAAVGTGLALLATGLGFAGQAVVFIALLAAGVAVALRMRGPVGPRALNTPESGLVGRHGTVLPTIGPGVRVRVGDSDWPARHVADLTLTAGETVRVEGVDGNVLQVRRPV